MSSEYSEVLYYPRPAYGPSELNTFPPPYPLSHLDPIILLLPLFVLCAWIITKLPMPEESSMWFVGTVSQVDWASVLS